jgi:hypothetical protein
MSEDTTKPLDLAAIEQTADRILSETDQGDVAGPHAAGFRKGARLCVPMVKRLCAEVRRLNEEINYERGVANLVSGSRLDTDDVEALARELRDGLPFTLSLGWCRTIAKVIKVREAKRAA